jgi:hypothetical protein
MVIFECSDDAAETQRRIEESQARQCHKPEFKFNKCSNDIRDKFFLSIRRLLDAVPLSSAP